MVPPLAIATESFHADCRGETGTRSGTPNAWSVFALWPIIAGMMGTAVAASALADDMIPDGAASVYRSAMEMDGDEAAAGELDVVVETEADRELTLDLGLDRLLPLLLLPLPPAAGVVGAVFLVLITRGGWDEHRPPS